MAVYAHELSHNLSIPDNYNNPFAAEPQRTASGMWDMMSRGSFNGPGGQHTRFQIPPTQGGALGAQHNLRNKRFLNFIADADILRLNRDGLAQSGIAVAEVKAREVAPNGDLAGVRVAAQRRGRHEPALPLPDRTRPARARGTRRPPATRSRARLQRLHDGGRPADRLGLLRAGPRRPDRQVEDRQLDLRLVQLLRLVHRLQPAGHQPGRLRQGRRHAGQGDDRRRAPDQRRLVQRRPELRLARTSTRPTATSLHFYIINKRTDADGILRYTVGVRSLDGSGPQTRGVSARRARRRAPPRASRPARSRSRTRARRRRPIRTLHPQDAVGVPRQRHLPPVGRRPSAPAGTAHLKNALATAKFGETVQVPVYIAKAAGAAASGSVTLTATSESDPTQDDVGDLRATDGSVGGIGAGDAGADAWARRRASAPFTPGLAARTTSPPPRRTSSPPPVTRR